MTRDPINPWPDWPASIEPAALLDGLTDGVIAVAANSKVIYMNPTAGSLTGWDPEAAAGTLVTEVFSLRDRPWQTVLNHVVSAIDGGKGSGLVTDCQLVTREGKQIPIDYSVSPGVGTIRGIMLIHDLSHGQEMRSQLEYQASHDHLTGLLNRETLQNRLSRLHHAAEAYSSRFSVLMLDVDRFKTVNDSYGHAVGDEVLTHVARRMQNTIRDRDVLGRWGGEEFLCLLPDSDRWLSVAIAERIRQQVASRAVQVQEAQIPVTASIGVATYPDDGDQVDQLLNKADAALYEAKRAGRNRVESSERIPDSAFGIAAQLERALDEARVRSAHQAIVDCQTGEIMAEESLARIISDDLVLEASKFIDIALQLRLMHRIDYQVLLETLIRRGSQTQRKDRELIQFVNMSSDLFRRSDLVKHMLDQIKSQHGAAGEGLAPEKCIVVEISEKQLLEDVDETRRNLSPFLESGIRVSLGDFGGGYSSLNYLSDLPVSFVKIGRDLVRRVGSDKRVRAIVQAVQDVSENLGVTTIAGCVEQQQTREVLQEIGINWAQGHLISRPTLH